MIVLSGMPIPPSVNELFENRFQRGSKAKRAMGNFSSSISRRKTPAYEHYELICKMWVNRNHAMVESARIQIKKWVESSYFVHCHILVAQPTSDFISKPIFKGRGSEKAMVQPPQPKGVDSNNYVKAQVDVLVKILGVDDKWFLGGSYEKVSCDGKESQCTVILTAQRIRTLAEIMKIYTEEPGSPNSARAIPSESEKS